MYDTQKIAFKVKKMAKERNVTIKQLLENCQLNVNTISELSKGKQISYLNFAKIADELGCSVDYLLGRTDETNAVNNSGSYISQKNIDGNATANINNESKRAASTDKITYEFIELFQSLDIADKIAVMNLALEKSKSMEDKL